ADFGTPAASVSNSARGIAKCLTIRLSDHAVELAVMAAALARYQSIVRHDISRLARARSVRAAEAADVRCPRTRPLLDFSEPTLFLNLGQSQRSDECRGYAALWIRSGVCGLAKELNLPALGAGGANSDFARATAVNIKP